MYSSHAYDAAYLLLYAYGAALFNRGDVQSGEVLTAELVSGIGQLQGGQSVAALPDSIPQGMSALANPVSGGMNLTGASGPLDLNEYGEPDYGPVSVWRPILESKSFGLTPVIDADGLLISNAGGDEANNAGETLSDSPEE